MKTVLFACVHNAGRSQMAAAWFRKLADSAKVMAVSAGTSPGVRVHPEVVVAMREVGVELAEQRPRLLDDELALAASLLVTMGCGEVCPHVPGLSREDWPLEDPKGKPIERVREIRDEVRARVAELLRREGWVAVSVRNATDAERSAVNAVLVESGLSLDGVAEHFGEFVVAEREGKLVGTAGLEVYARYGLLRSLAVLPEARGLGLGRALMDAQLARARALGLRSVILLTTSAEKLFEHAGFRRIERTAVPVEVTPSSAFQGMCPGTAAVMQLDLAP